MEFISIYGRHLFFILKTFSLCFYSRFVFQKHKTFVFDQTNGEFLFCSWWNFSKMLLNQKSTYLRSILSTSQEQIQFPSFQRFKALPLYWNLLISSKFYKISQTNHEKRSNARISSQNHKNPHKFSNRIRETSVKLI